MLLLAVGVPAEEFVLTDETLELSPLNTVAFPVPSCWNTKDVPLTETCCVWTIDLSVWTMEKSDERSGMPEH